MSMRIRIFDDIYSFLHFAFGFLATILHIDVAAAIVFVAYETFEKERLAYKLGDYIEFAAGLITGRITAIILGLRC